MTSDIISQLYGMIKEHPLVRKFLVVHSYAAGHQWIQRMSRELGPVLNLEPITMEGLALKHVQTALSERGLRYATAEETYWIVHSLMRNAAAFPWGGYVPKEFVTPGIVEDFNRSLRELREAGLTGESLAVGAFEKREKGVYVVGLLTAYMEELEKHRLVDFAGLISLVGECPAAADALYIVDSALASTGRNLLERITGGEYVLLPQEVAFTASDSRFPYESADWFQALGPLAEGKETIRRLAASGARWDDAECLLSDYRTYAPVLFALCRRFDIACTFAGGLPLRFASLGRAALMYLEWLETGFRTETIAAAFKQGIVRVPDGAPFRRSDAIRQLETAGIGWGRERYVMLSASAALFEREQDRAAAIWLDGLCRRWFEPLPVKESEWSASHVAEGLTVFLDCCHTPSSRGDADVIAFVRELGLRISCWFTGAAGAPLAVRMIRRQLERCMVEVDGIPQPGKLHVASIDNGGLSGRRHTYVLGMSEENWSTSIRQDPVLLDDERVRIHPSLESSGERARRLREDRHRRLGGLRGRCTLSFSSLRLADQSESSPAYELLQLYRIATGRLEADFETLASGFQEPVACFGGTSPTMEICLEDPLIRRLLTPERIIRDGADCVYWLFPSLGAGQQASFSRRETAMGAYDGILSPASHEGGFVPAVFSASKMETYAKCPLKFFFQEALGIRAKEVVQYDRTRWLDALQRGQLLHDIFFAYMSETAADGGTHRRGRLDALCERKLIGTAARIPAPSPHIFAKESDSIRKDVAAFWRMEQRRRSKPVFFELELHRGETAFSLTVAEDFTLPLRGFVDRIDETAPHQYKIIDYKTGNPKYYEEGTFFAGGTQIQHALYAVAVEQWLRTAGGDPAATVSEAAYAFPTERGLGEEVVRPQTGRRDDTVGLLRSAVAAMENGLFPPTDKPELCRRCEYAPVCGTHAVWKKDARFSPDNRERLSTLLEVNRSV